MTNDAVEYPLWPSQSMPHAKAKPSELAEKAVDSGGCIRNITQPTLTVYPAQGENSGVAVVVIPGGGYEMVCMQHEGHQVAEILAGHGITAVILKYRLPNPTTCTDPHLVPIADARQALKRVRAMAGDYGIDPAKVGVLGFSAGSHLSTCACLWPTDDEDAVPAFAGLIYGVTNLRGNMRPWLETSLYFHLFSTEELAHNDLLAQVNEVTPPTFLAHAYDDDICDVTESTLYAEKLHAHGVPVEMHLFPAGGHGFGLGRAADGTDQWPGLFVNWLKRTMQV